VSSIFLKPDCTNSGCNYIPDT